MLYSELVDAPEKLKGHIALVKANDPHMMEVVRVILTKTQAEISIYDTENVSELIQEFQLEDEVGQRLHIYQAENEDDMYAMCEAHLEAGQTQILMKGHIMTADILKFVLRRKHFMRDERFLNHVACFDIPGYKKALLMTDPALNVSPSIEDRIKMVKQLHAFAQQLGYSELKVGLLSSIEKATKSVPSSVEAAEIKDYFTEHPVSQLKVDGPFAFDNALNVDNARRKGIQSEVAGDVDALIVPQLDVGNVLYKSLTQFGGAETIGTVVGAKFPIVLTSRTDDIQSKFNSVVLALKLL
ncbi:phosphate acyltransferase [Staphylococcus pettenkoferi]|uniref:phosphate acyltransferase n=1 Tax=Staphylococcus pettenkoferi TaxID=170573 RepID=UPI002272B21C|nr:phosphate acyltransferase [Staphylococcus pettenkoferi]MCY1601233.1 phosphate acyltransferase [Staphylococcus pettenkoferi]